MVKSQETQKLTEVVIVQGFLSNLDIMTILTESSTAKNSDKLTALIKWTILKKLTGPIELTLLVRSAILTSLANNRTVLAKD